MLEKVGRVRIVKNNTMLPASFLDISAQVHTWEERGLLGIAFDPDFAANHWLYLYYTALTPVPHNRVSRFTAAGDTVVACSKTVIIDLTNLSNTVGYHNGGGVLFEIDGKLYPIVGEYETGSNAQSLINYLGKMLRLNKDGTRPTDNPFYDPTDSIRSAIWCLGLRNPFTFAIQPGTGRILIDDVGAAAWEEINDVVKGANFGWPGIEGMRTTQTAPTNYHDPLQTYNHGLGTAICGGDFYNPSARGPDAFPTSYTGHYFISDYRGWIKQIDPADHAVGRENDRCPWYLERRHRGRTYTITATTGGTSGIASVTEVPSFAVTINFQPAQAMPPAGYLVDSGLVYATRGNGYTYG